MNNNLFTDNCPELTYEDATLQLKSLTGSKLHGFIDKIFSVHPDDWYSINFDEHLNSIKNTSGLKIRVPLSDLNLGRGGNLPGMQAIDYIKTYFAVTDMVVFSPAPPWLCNYATIEASIDKVWPEFSIGIWGSAVNREIYISGGLADFFALHAAIAPLLKRGKVAYLPLPNFGWSNSGKMTLPQPPILNSSDPVSVAKRAMFDLYIEHAVSKEIGCHHVFPRTADRPIISSGISNLTTQRQIEERAHIIMRLNIPRIENASFAELCQIQEDEADSFLAFRKAIREAVDQAHYSSLEELELSVVVQKIQTTIIDEPYHRLLSKLRRLEKIRRKKYASYAVLTTSAALVAAFEPSLSGTAASILTGVSLSKIMDTYFTDLEKEVSLSSEATYWITKIKG